MQESIKFVTTTEHAWAGARGEEGRAMMGSGRWGVMKREYWAVVTNLLPSINYLTRWSWTSALFATDTPLRA